MTNLESRISNLWTAKAVLFDLDGTLVDTAPDLGYAANCVRAEVGLPPLPDADYRPVASAGARGLLSVALGIGLDHADFPMRRDSFLAHYRLHLARSSRLFPGMDEFLRSMEQRGIRWGVMTNKPSWLTNPLMDELDLGSRAACCISADEVAKAKPAPDGLLKCCELLGVSVAECIYVGDDKRDVDAARNCGMRSIAADWGYLGAEGPIEGWNADWIARTPAQLAEKI